MANANISCKVSNAFKKSLGSPGGPPAPPGGLPATASSTTSPPTGPVVEEEIDFNTITDVQLTPGQEAWLTTKGAAAWGPVADAKKNELMTMTTLGPLLKAAGLAAPVAAPVASTGGRYNRKRNKRTKRNGNKTKQKRTRQNKRKNRNKKTNKRR